MHDALHKIQRPPFSIQHNNNSQMEELSAASTHKRQIQKLQNQSVSEGSDNPNQIPNQSIIDSQPDFFPNKNINRRQLHSLIYSSEKTYDLHAKKEIDKYTKKVININNDAYLRIIAFDHNNTQINQKIKSDMAKHGSAINVRADPITENTIKSQKLINSKQKNSNQHIVGESKDKQIASLLLEAQNILQYAASCGKTIDRNLILCVLCNQAAFYQKIWNLKNCCIYLQAVILNMEQWGEESHWSQCSGCSLSLISKNSQPPYLELNFIKSSNKSINIQSDMILLNMRKWRLLSPLNNIVGQYNTEQYQKLAKNYQLDQNISKLSIYKGSEQIQSYQPQYQSPTTETNKYILKHHTIQIFQLSIYYLQFSSICGQRGQHQQAINNAEKLIKKLKKITLLNRKIFAIEHSRSLSNKKSHIFPLSDLLGDKRCCEIIEELNLQKLIQGLAELNYQIDWEPQSNFTELCESYRQTAKHFFKLHLTLNSTKNQSLITKKYQNQRSSKISEQAHNLQKQLRQLSISDLLKIKCKQYKFSVQQGCNELNDKGGMEDREQFLQDSSRFSCISIVQNYSIFELSKNMETLSFSFVFANALVLSTAYFILATELRLLAMKQEQSEGQRFSNANYKKSEIFHLSAIIILSIYIPLQMNYLKHMVTSYETYYVHQLYPRDEMMSNEYENGPCAYSINSKIQQKNVLRDQFDSCHIYKIKKPQCTSINQKGLKEVDETQSDHDKRCYASIYSSMKLKDSCQQVKVVSQRPGQVKVVGERSGAETKRSKNIIEGKTKKQKRMKKKINIGKSKNKKGKPNKDVSFHQSKQKEWNFPTLYSNRYSKDTFRHLPSLSLSSKALLIDDQPVSKKKSTGSRILSCRQITNSKSKKKNYYTNSQSTLYHKPLKYISISTNIRSSKINGENNSKMIAVKSNLQLKKPHKQPLYSYQKNQKRKSKSRKFNNSGKTGSVESKNMFLCEQGKATLNEKNIKNKKQFGSGSLERPIIVKEATSFHKQTDIANNKPILQLNSQYRIKIRQQKEQYSTKAPKPSKRKKTSKHSLNQIVAKVPKNRNKKQLIQK